MQDSEGVRYDRELYAGEDALDIFQELFQGQKMKGKVIFKIPESATGLKLNYDFGNVVTGTKLATWEIK